MNHSTYLSKSQDVFDVQMRNYMEKNVLVQLGECRTRSIISASRGAWSNAFARLLVSVVVISLYVSRRLLVGMAVIVDMRFYSSVVWGCESACSIATCVSDLRHVFI